MTKNIIYILSFTLLIACKSGTYPHASARQAQKDTPETNPIANSEKIEVSKPNLGGVWGLTNYLDTIVQNKEVVKYRTQAPSWFGILLEIKNDSLFSYGSLIEIEQQINLQSDTLTHFDTYGGKWNLVRAGELLLLTKPANENRNDTISYTYRKRADLDFMTQNMDRVHKISSNLTNYFNEKLVAGAYQNMALGKNATLKPNGELIGFEKYDTYQIRNYFGTRHPHNNLDVITFSNSITNEVKQYNWKFKDDLLILTEFVNETIVNGERVIMDDYVLGAEKIELSIRL